MYVNVHVFVPTQGGSALGTPAEIVNARLQLSNTAGGIGTVAFAAQATVDDPPAGMITVGPLIV